MSVEQFESLSKVLGDIKSATEVKPQIVFPTGLLGIDKNVLGCGGLPGGRYITLKSATGAGKSSLALYLVGIVQKAGGLCAWIETEGTFTSEYAQSCGVNIEDLDYVDDFTTGEDALYRIKQRIATNAYDLIVIDSKDYLIPESISESKTDRMNQHDEQQQAKMFAMFFKNLFGGFTVTGADGKTIKSNRVYCVGKDKVDNWHKLQDKKTCLLFIEHAKDDLKSFFPGATRTSGGEESKFGATIRLGMKLKGTKKEGDKILYKEVEVFADKNKLGLPFGSARLLLYANGKIEEKSSTILVDFGIEKKIIKQTGGWFSIGDAKFQGKEAIAEYIEQNPELKEEILK